MVNNLQSDTARLIGGFVGIIVAIVLLASSADSISIQTSTFTVTNLTVTAPATNASLALGGRELVPGTTPTTYNATNFSEQLQDLGVFVESTILNGAETVALTVNQTGNAFAGTSINVSYENRPDGFIDDAGGRNITNLIVIIAGIAILVFSVALVFSTNAGRNLLQGFR